MMQASPNAATCSEGTSIDEHLERIHLRFALIESDEQLQKFTDNYLIQLIETAGSEPRTVQKVREILSQYNRRAKSNASISYPIKDLVTLIKERGAIAANLSLVYLRYACANLAEEQQAEYLPLILEAVSSRISEPAQNMELLALCVPGFMIISQKDKQTWPTFSLTSDLKTLLLRFFYCIIAFDVNSTEDVQQVCAFIKNSKKVFTYGMSPDEFLFIAEKVFCKNVSFVQIKLAVIKLLVSGLFDDQSIFSILVLATAQSIEAVSDVAETSMKRMDIQTSVDNRVIVDELMAIYLGVTLPSKPVLGKATTVSPVCTIMKQKILHYLTRSDVAPIAYMNNMKVCLEGLTHVSRTESKLLIAALNFLVKVIEKMPAAAQKNFGPLLFDRVQKIQESEVKNGVALSLMYRCLGLLGKRDSSILTAQTDTIERTFRSIAEAPDDVAYAVVDCLTQWLEGFRKLKDVSLMDKLKTLIQEFITHENSKCRLIALKYMEGFLTSDEIELRWMLLQSCGDSRDEIKGEAIRLLDVSLQVDVPVELVVSYLWSQLNVDIVDPETGKEKSPSSQTVPPAVHQICSRYLWAIMGRSAGVNVDLKTTECGYEWIELSPKIARQMRQVNKTHQERMTAIALKALKEAQDVHLFHIAACFFAVCPASFSSPASVTACLQRACGTTRTEMANVAAHLAASLLKEKEREQMLSSIFAALDKTNITAGDCWLASAFIASYSVPNSTVLSSINKLVNIAEGGYNKPNNVLESALGALANILRRILSQDKSFILPPEDLKNLLSVCEKIAVSRKDAVSTKAHEEATLAIGFCATSLDDDLYEKLTSSLYSVGVGPPQPEVQLIVGSALFDVALAQYSSSRRILYVEAEEDFQLTSLPAEVQDKCENRLAQILTKIFEKLPSTNHHERRSALIWLFVVARKSFKIRAKVLRGMLEKIQSAFSMGLAENDDFIQDIASNGIGLVYEMASADQRKALVNELISNISEGKPFSAAKLDSNSVIFGKEQKITGPDGQHLSTYKELCSLATDLNQPDLVYKFMSLARHNSVWNMKKGAALGFAAVLEEARSELDPYINQLVPKLFRYRYDPDLRVRQSMRSIWSVLTSSRRGIIDEFADDIAKELQQQLTSPEWRVRESACLALSDLVQGHDSAHIRSVFPDLLLTVFRLRDDIKESVRLAANRAVASLGKLAVRFSSGSSKGHDPHAFLDSFLPVLIRNGIHSDTKVNKQFSISLLLELAKTAGKQLRPFLADLIPSLIDAISDAEPAILNYVAARSSLAELEMLDDARAQIARTSPIMTAIHDLIPQIDSSVLTGIQPRLCEQLRSSVGASTRTACAQLLTVIALRAPQLLMDHPAQCDKFFNALIAGTRDRNPSVRKHFASTLSYLAKYASSTCFETLMKSISKDLLGDDETIKQSAKHVLKNLSANCPELLQGYSKLVVPCVFLEKCQLVIRGDETSKKRHEEWCELWNEIVPSTDAAVRLYRQEILVFILDVLQNNDVWSVRAQAARMLTETMGCLRDRIDGKDASMLLSSLIPLLSGRIWTGKECLVNAVGAVFACTGASLREYWGDKEMEEAFASLSTQASKKKKDYAAAGLLACGTFAQSLSYGKAADWVFEKVEENVKKAFDPSEDEEQSEDEEGNSATKEAKLAEFIGQNMTALTKAAGAYCQAKDASAALGHFCSYLTSSTLFWKAKLTLAAGLLELVGSWNLEISIESTKLVEALLTMAGDMLEQQRKSVAVQGLSVVTKIAQRSSAFTVQWDEVKTRWGTSRVVQEIGLFDDLANMNLSSFAEANY